MRGGDKGLGLRGRKDLLGDGGLAPMEGLEEIGRLEGLGVRQSSLTRLGNLGPPKKPKKGVLGGQPSGKLGEMSELVASEQGEWLEKMLVSCGVVGGGGH